MADEPTKQLEAEAGTSPPPKKTARRRKRKTSPAQKPESAAAAAGFGGLGLSDTALDALAKADYLEPTPVQAGLIPKAWWEWIWASPTLQPSQRATRSRDPSR